MKSTYNSLILLSIIISIAFSLFFTSSYLLISTNSCEKTIENEKFVGIILDSQTIKPSSQRELLEFINKLKENRSFFLLTEKGIYSCVYSSKNYFKVEEKSQNLLNIPLNFHRYESKENNIERLKLSKIDYIQDFDGIYIKEPDYKLGKEVEVKFFAVMNIPIENGTVKINDKIYLLEEIKNKTNVIIANESVIIRQFLFNQSCVKRFEYSESRRIVQIVNIKLEVEDACKEILEKVLNVSGIKIIYNEKYFEYPIEIDIENETVFQFYIPFSKSLQKEINSVMIFENPIDIKKLENVKLYILPAINFTENSNFRIFTLDFIPLITFAFVLSLSYIKRRKIDFLFFVSFIAFLSKIFMLISSALFIILSLLRERKITHIHILLILIGIFSFFYNPAYTLFLPLLTFLFSFIEKNSFIISLILLALSLPLFFFFEWLSFLLLVSSFVLLIKNLR